MEVIALVKKTQQRIAPTPPVGNEKPPGLIGMDFLSWVQGRYGYSGYGSRLMSWGITDFSLGLV